MNLSKFVDLQFWALLGFALTVPFSKALANIFIVATAIFWVIECVLARKFIFPKIPFYGLVVVFILSLFISFFETDFYYQSYRGITKVLQRFGLFFLVIHVFSVDGRFEKFFKWLSVGYLVILVNGFIQAFVGHDLIRGREVGHLNNVFVRITSTFEFPDQYGVYLVYLIFIFIFLAVLKGSALKTRLYYFLLTLMGVASLFMTHSRAAWISFFAALIFSSLFMKRAVLSFVGVVTVLFFVMMASPSDVLIHKDAEGKEQSLSERLVLWSRAVEMVKAHPITGVGINTYDREVENYRKDDKENLIGYYSHNGFLQMAAESGLITASVYLAFLVSLLVAGFYHLKKGLLSLYELQVMKAVIAGAIGFIVLNNFETSLFSVQPAQLYYFFLGVLCCLINRSRAVGKIIKS